VSPLFTINFRREAYLQEVARRRRRVIALGVWVAYFGILAIVLGFYVLNAASLARRASILERQTAQIRRANSSTISAKVRPAGLALVEKYASSTRRWRDRLARLGAILPPESRVLSIAVNPQNQSDLVSRNSLVITGELKGGASQDRMGNVMKIVAAMRSDSLFRIGYGNIKLSSTRVNETGAAEFVIECR
jgi:hypothetical protein